MGGSKSLQNPPSQADLGPPFRLKSWRVLLPCNTTVVQAVSATPPSIAIAESVRVVCSTAAVVPGLPCFIS
jgi:hypothetical protein